MKGSIRRLTNILLIVLIVLNIFTFQNFSEDNIKVYVNKNELTFDVHPLTIDGRVLVPLRAILEKLGANVNWDPQTKTVIAIKGQTVIQLQLDNKNAIVNGKSVVLDVPLKAINGRTLVPIRFVSENLGTNVTWDSSTRTISITDKSSNELDNVPKDKIRNGIDKYTWNSGTTYEGEWSNNKINGKGVLIYANGDKYSGSFVNNKKSGYGTYTWANSDSYSGNWANDKMNGYGIYKFENGDEYSGNWDEGYMNGQGTYIYKDGTVLTGIWSDNKYSSED